MDNLPTWAVSTVAAAVGVAPVLAILSAPAIARLLHRLLWARPGVTPEAGCGPARARPAHMATRSG